MHSCGEQTSLLPRDDCGATTPLDRGKEARERRRPLTSEAVPESLKRKGWEGRQEVTQLWPLWGDRSARNVLGSSESCLSETKQGVFTREGQARLRGSKKPIISGPDEPTRAAGIKGMESEGLGKAGCDSRFQIFKRKSELRFVLKGS